MIDERTFKAEWAVLAERFGKYIGSSEMPRRYYQSLSPRMDTGQFVTAARRLFDSAEFFPKPDDFLEAAGLSQNAMAEADWVHARDVMNGYDTSYALLSAEGMRVIQAMGGVRALQSTRTGQESWRQREFMRLYGPPAEWKAVEGKVVGQIEGSA